MQNLKTKIIVICGPTGVGKTSFAIKLASMFHGQIIGADSMQIYKYMDIGTAKPTLEEQTLIPHHLIDIIEPDQNFNAAQYAKMAVKNIDSLESKNITPFIVGGTGLYIKALVHGMFENNASDSDLKNSLKAQAAEYGTDFLYQKLTDCDPDAASAIHPNDTYRIIRAIEVYKLTGKPISEYRKEHSFSDNIFKVLKIGLQIKRELLYERIEMRVDKMIEHGFLKEVTNLLKIGYSPNIKSMKSIGYRHIVDYIIKNVSLSDTITTMKQDTRRYGKRQMTWFKADPEIKWLTPEELNNAKILISEFLYS